MARVNPEVAVLLELIDQAFDHRAWHGTNLKGAIRGISAREASWRPGPGRHNIWEETVHAAYWKYTVRRRILGEKRGSFALKGSNWFARPEGAPSEAAWKADVALLVETHKSLRAAVAPYDLPEPIVQQRLLMAAMLLFHGLADHSRMLEVAQQGASSDTELFVHDLEDSIVALLSAPLSANTRARLSQLETAELEAAGAARS